MLSGAYVTAIEDAFLAHSGRGLMISARDLELIKRWARAGLPVEVVVQGIERAFDHRKRSRTIRGLEDVQKSVEVVAKDWRARNVGGRTEAAGVLAPEMAPGGQATDPSVEEAALARAFDELIERVESARAELGDARLIPLVELLVGRLSEIRDGTLAGAVPDPVTALEQLETRATEAFWARLDPDLQSWIKEQVEAMLADTRALSDPSSWQAAFDRQRLRQVRAHLGLPDLQLNLAPAW